MNARFSRSSALRRLSLSLGAVAVLATAACGNEPPAGQQDSVWKPPQPPPGAGGSGGGEGGTGGTGGEGGAGGAGGGTTVQLRLDDVRPPRGTTAGGESVMINGAGFVTTLQQDDYADAVTEVLFGGNAAIGVRVIDDDTIIVPTPPGLEGDVDVVIRNPYLETTCAGCYRYQAPVTLSSVEPAEGSINGGTTVTLRGQNLRDSMFVIFGNRAALDVELQADGSLVVVAPPADREGATDVRVFDADGQGYLRKGYSYRASLAVAAIEPAGGPLAGGNRIKIEGAGFSETTQVRIDGVAVDAILESDGSLSVVAPAAAAPGAVAVEVSTEAASVTAAYAYFDPSATGVNLYVVSPGSGSVAGGDEVTLVGTGLDAANLAVRFDGVLATATAIDGNFVTATVPAGAAAAAVDVSVRVATGGATLSGGYRYLQTIDLDDVQPSGGPEAGGTAITVTGAGFPPGARLFVGALEAEEVVRIDANTITARSPKGTDGPVPVRVVDPADATNEGTLRNGFVYSGTFSVSRLDPTLGARAGGTRTVVRGSGFRPGLAATFGLNAATEIEVQDPYTAYIFSPRGEIGTVDVQIESGAGENTTLAGAFTYFDPSNTYGGASGGPLNGTINITVLDAGDRFGTRRGLPLPGSLVTVGTDDGSALTGLSDDRGQITFSDPRLVKAQVVSVTLDRYESTTVVNQESENLTVFMTPNFDFPECDNGIDDDGDGLIDNEDLDGCQCGPQNSPMPDLCMCPMMKMEPATCCDGIDNDNDGQIDGDDEECQCSGGSSEGPLAGCSNCKDDDRDGTWDYINMAGPSDRGCASGTDEETGALVMGRVYGFKLPAGRRLAANEEEVAFVTYSLGSVYSAPPFGGNTAIVTVGRDGGSYAFEFPIPRLMAVYATYGIRNTESGSFEPVLMGVRRNVNAHPDAPITDANIVLDMHLGLDVPVTIQNPPVFLGAPGFTTVSAYMELGSEGVIPLGHVVATSSTATIENLPMLSGEAFTFRIWGDLAGGIAGGDVAVPFNADFRRQSGDLTQGVTVGPLMGLTRMVQPTGVFNGVIEWTSESGPAAEIAVVQIEEPTMAGPIPQWNMVVPGSERRVVVPASVVETLRAKYRNTQTRSLSLRLITGREPRFSYDQWNYSDLYLNSFTSFTYDVVSLQLF